MYAFKPYVFTEHSPNSIAKPEGRMKSKIRCDGKNLYIYSGEDPTVVTHRRESGNVFSVSSKPEFRDIWVYNLAKQQWRLMTIDSNLPDINDFIVGTIFESNSLFICTIRKPFNRELSSRKCRLHICDLNTESILVQGTSGHIPCPPSAVNFIRHEKYFYIVGVEENYGYFSDVYKLNMENGVWEVDYISQGLNDHIRDARMNPTLVYDNNMIYKFDGYSSDFELDELYLDEISAFDLEKRCWKIVNTLGDENHMPHYPSQRKDFGLTSYTDPDSGEVNVIISGGKDYEYRDTLDDVWRLNLTSLKWSCLQRFGAVLPHHVENHSMTVSPAGKLFTFGGHISINMEDGTCSSTLHSTWLRIPKLEDICWEAVFHYYPDLKSMTDKEIMSLGLPLQLLKSRIN
ncbi:kelch domain-containing protein 10 homolog isoform X1 [Microplitis mediator]|uniref:kelch domain-containing protein 10 homolog isoform X1 n=2 Tax=Microplitis mediator TaxID=375433 RepID=UPI00255668DE|nr:kelch domain-containing protein 10 homolog isoform X1 [Microplitis mediator]